MVNYSWFNEEKLLKIEIRDNGEPLVPIKQHASTILIDYSKTDFYKLKAAGFRRPVLRKRVAELLGAIQKRLPSNLTLVIRDAWRPIELQREIYESFVKKFRKRSPNFSKTQIKKEVDKFVADPDGRIPPGHTTGGAVDITLAYKASKRKIPMKTSKLSYEDNAKIFSPKLSKRLRKNRKILFNVMTKAGFANYPNEWWHYSYGDAYWAARTNRKTAFYDKVEKIKDES